MIKKILAIAGKPGLYSLVSNGKNMFIVESLQTKKRMPAYAHDKVISLADISIYTTEGDVPLAQVLQAVCDKADAKPVDVKALGSDQAIRDFFAEVLPAFDRDRVYTTDIKKLLSWYNILIAAGWDKFVEDAPAEAPEKE
ncbi:MAG: DUF5606 domain-containing protein [Clostridium sp.]|nr:DUF5606 domain-containing protein [Clostridium sp.]